MSTIVLFILLALSTVGQALQHETADNTTKLTLEDIFGSPDLGKRGWPFFKTKKLPMIKVPLVKEDTQDMPRWFINVQLTPSQIPKSARPNLPSDFTFKFQIDTCGVCTWVPEEVNFFQLKWQGKGSSMACPARPYASSTGEPDFIAGMESNSQIPITLVSGLTWKGRLLKARLKSGYGSLGLGLFSDINFGKAFPWPARLKKMHSLSSLLENFDSPVFALFFSQQGSELHIGGIQETQDKIQYYKVVRTRSDNSWRIGELNIFVNDKLIISNKLIMQRTAQTGLEFTTIFDSSTPYIYGPPVDMDKLVRAIDMAQRVGHRPAVHFQWEGRKKWPFITGNRSWFDILKAGPQHMTDWVLGTEVLYSSGYYLVFKSGEMGIRSGPMPLVYRQRIPHKNLPYN